MRTDSRTYLLDHLGVLRISGPDARTFLQGQLSNDLDALGSERLLLAGYHNPQGRVIALLRLALCADQSIIALLPRELVASVAARLRRFVLRSRLTIADASDEFTIHGTLGDAAAVLGPTPVPGVMALPIVEGALQRVFVIQSREQTALSAPMVLADARQWQTLEVAAGVPEIGTATSEKFVAQMLNLDCIDGISFRKGCYTGQEVIARAHFRGRVKRRLQRFDTDAATTLEPGAAVQLQDGRNATIINVAEPVSGRRQFLAVTPLPSVSANDEAETSPSSAPRIGSHLLPLPYPLPA